MPNELAAFSPPPTPAPAGPDLASINTNQQHALGPRPASNPHEDNFVRSLLYGLQGVDAVTSGKLFSKPGTFERDPLMKPFSHGGAPTMALGFALSDLLRDRAMKHASQGQKNSAMGAQALLNGIGISQTMNAPGWKQP